MLEYITTTATTPVLMWLYRLAGAGSFCFNSILPFFWLYMHPHDLTLKPYHSKYFCTHCSQDFLGWPFFLFPVISTSITSHTWELISACMTWPYHTADGFKLLYSQSIFTTTPYYKEHQSIPYQSVSPSDIILIIWRSTPCNLVSSATVSSHHISQ